MRRRRAPAVVTRRLDPDDMVLSFAEMRDGRVLTASRRGLWLSDAEDAKVARWEDIVTAVWGEGVLTVTEGSLVQEHEGFFVVERRPPWRAAVPVPRGLPAAVRERVTRSVAVTERHDIAGHGVLVVGRRLGGTREIRWCVVFDDQGDYRDEALVRAAGVLVGRAQERWGDGAG